MGITAGIGEAMRIGGVRTGPLEAARAVFTPALAAKIGGLRRREAETRDADDDLGRAAREVLAGLSGESERSRPSDMTVSGGGVCGWIDGSTCCILP